MLSSGMYVERPLVKVGIQIGNIRALPVEFALVDDGAAPLLFGSIFLEKLFDMQAKGIGGYDADNDITAVTIEPPEKYDPDSLGIRLVPEGKSVDAIQLEKFLRSVRTIHNVGVIACERLHQHNDWQGDNARRKVGAVANTITSDCNLYDQNTLHISWIENGSVWLSLKSGSKAAFSWLSQLFEKTTDARLRKTIAEAASAEEDALIKQLTRDEIANAKKWEQRRIATKHIKDTRKDWQQTVLGEIDFRAKLIERIEDPEIRAEAERQIDQALKDLVSSNFMPVIENIPKIEPSERDVLLMKKQDKDNLPPDKRMD
ncbi:MAG TPA: hypothetical protein DDY22_07525 [Geobacter sp.]|nr:hypothetical protein [Geobacter sp.]